MISAALIALAVTAGCGGGASPGASTGFFPSTSTATAPSTPTTPTPNPTISISVSPQSVTLNSGDSQQFEASVSGSSDLTVTWLVNGVVGGGNGTGTISDSGLYDAPATTTQLNLAVTARSNADPTKSADVAVTVDAPPSPPPSASDYYVSTSGNDSNSGTSSKPWKTIGHAASVVKAGATVHVAAGEYDENVISSTSGTSSARIRYISDVQGAAHIVGGAGDAIWENKGDYVDIMGFDITGTAAIGIDNLASFVRILGNTVHDIVAGCDSNGGAGIDNEGYTAHDDDVGFNIVHDVRAASGCAQRHGVGIYHANLRGHVYNNLVFQTGAEAIQLWHAANAVVVANNTVIDNDDTGILIGAGDSPGGITNDNTIVINNIALNNARYGILEYGTTGPHNIYQNNLIFGSTNANIQLITGTVSGTITADPQLVNNTGNASGDYHLGPKSPAIDAGVAPNAPTTDIVGGTRPQGKAMDIGAYEMGATPAKWPWL